MRVVFVDFDGVFHATTDIEGLDLAAMALHGGDRLADAGLFRWTRQLAEALRDTEAVVVVHSTWRRASWAAPIMRILLGPLGSRFVSCTRSDLSREDSIKEFVERAAVDDFIILDDAYSEFGELSEHLICTNPLLGLSEHKVLDDVRNWATAHSSNLCVPVP